MSKRAGLALRELVVTLAGVALLGSMVMAGLLDVREKARKAVCASLLSNFGRAGAVYVTEYNSYPHFAPDGLKIEGLSAWRGFAFPKLYTLLHFSGIEGTHKTNWGVPAYLWEADEIWSGALCPAMDHLEVLQWAYDGVEAGQTPPDKVAMHPAAVAYQWNPALRAAGPGSAVSGSGRFSSLLWPATEAVRDDNTRWIDWRVFLPDGEAYAAQAITPEEIRRPQFVAEAWDSWDINSAPNVSKADWNVENVLPGWHVGPQSDGTKGWAMLNGRRHLGSPNILYADGHVAADATRKLTPSDLGTCPAGSWKGIQAVSWNDYDETFGTMGHIVPRQQIESQ